MNLCRVYKRSTHKRVLLQIIFFIQSLSLINNYYSGLPITAHVVHSTTRVGQIKFRHSFDMNILLEI